MDVLFNFNERFFLESMDICFEKFVIRFILPEVATAMVMFCQELGPVILAFISELPDTVELESEAKKDSELIPLINAVNEGLKAEQRPERVSCGVNGTYFMKDKTGDNIAIFKPADEEFCGVDASEGDSAAALSEEFGLLPGETVYREAAAYRVAHEHPDGSFQNVPPTCLVNITSPRSTFAVLSEGEQDLPVTKFGSLQAFVDADGDSEEFGSRLFLTDDVHRIGVLDLQILNCDRNSQNLLVKRLESGDLSLIPIDHGFSMPAGLSLGAGRFEWLNYPAAKKPFSQRLLDYIAAISPERILTILRDEFNIRDECLTALWISNTFLQLGAAAGLCLHDIGDAVCRRDIEKPSDLELVLASAKAVLPEADPGFSVVLLGKLKGLIKQISATKQTG